MVVDLKLDLLNIVRKESSKRNRNPNTICKCDMCRVVVLQDVPGRTRRFFIGPVPQRWCRSFKCTTGLTVKIRDWLFAGKGDKSPACRQTGWL